MAVTDQQLAQWERLAKEAAPGPWKQNGDTGQVIQTQRSDLPALEIVDTTQNANRGIENARFIAAARQAVPDLAAEVRRLREEVERLKKEERQREREACASFLETEASAIEAGTSTYAPKALTPYSAAGEVLRKAARAIRADTL